MHLRDAGHTATVFNDAAFWVIKAEARNPPEVEKEEEDDEVEGGAEQDEDGVGGAVCHAGALESH